MGLDPKGRPSVSPQTAQGRPTEGAPGAADFISIIPAATDAKADTLVICCSSARFQPHFRDFLANGLKLSQYDLLAVPGGVQWLALPDILPKHNKVARWTTEFLVRRHALRRVVCIAHEDCSAYTDNAALASLSRLATGRTIREHQLDQLRKVGANLAEWFAIAPELYFLSIRDTAVVFQKIT